MFKNKHPYEIFVDILLMPKSAHNTKCLGGVL